MTSTVILHGLKFRICFLKLLVFILTAHQHLSIFLPNNPRLTFKVRPFYALCSNLEIMGYQLVSKHYPEIISKDYRTKLIEKWELYAEIKEIKFLTEVEFSL